jgi:gliding motility-associated-like protein
LKIFSKHSVLCALLLFFYVRGNSQITADFTATVTQGCSPVVVNFNDLSSSASPITYRNWSFGNGNFAIGNNANPVATYLNPGTYTVTLTVSNGTDTAVVSKAAFITVFANPQAKFSFTRNECFPIHVAFNNTSTQGSGAITQFNWSFGDGSPINNQQNPTHTYNQVGTYTVSLSVTDINGCISTKDSLSAVVVPAKLTANITHTGASQSCQPPLNVNFVGAVTGGSSPYTYLWDLGNSQTSTQANPTNLYSQVGLYTISLIVTDNKGCKDTVIKPNYVSITQTIANFTAPDTVCKFEDIMFSNTSVGGSNFNWNFGNGQSSTSFEPTFAYQNSGNYTVRLIASSGPGCIDSITKTIHVEHVEANFTMNRLKLCHLPDTVVYTNTSTSNVVQWSYFVYLPPIEQPTHSSFNSDSSFTRTFITSGFYNSRLIVTTQKGCKDTLLHPDTVIAYEPKVDFYAVPAGGCAPKYTQFFNSSYSPASAISSMFWTFGQGDTSSLQNPDSIYFGAVGTYTVCLKITTIDGCSDSLCKDYKLGALQTADFYLDKDTICFGDTVQVIDISTDSLLIDYRLYSFFDKALQTEVFSPKVVFTDTGIIKVRLIVGNNGCFDTLTVDSAVYVSGPLGSSGVSFNNCLNDREVTLNALIGGYTRFYWEIQDTNTVIDSVNLTITHVFSDTGKFTVKFYVYNDSTNCMFEEEKEIHIPDRKLSLVVSDTMICSGQMVQFNFSGSKNYGNTYIHYGLNDSSFVSITSKQYLSKGLYTVRLTGQFNQICADTIIKHIRVVRPQADFTMNSPPCLDSVLQFTDTSIPDTNLVSWYWDFDGLGTSSIVNPSYTFFTDSSDYYSTFFPQYNKAHFVTLTITDTMGCSNSITKTITLHKPRCEIVIDDKQACKGQSISFSNLFPSSIMHNWDFGDGQNTSVSPTNHSYLAGGVYTVKLRIVTASGCVANAIDSLEIQEITGVGFMANKVDTSCYPVVITFTDTTNSSGIQTRNWDFGTGSPPVNVSGNTATYQFNYPGNFDITLLVVTPFGCTDSVSMHDFINVRGPYAEFSVNKDSICKGEVLSFLVDTFINLGSYTFDFGDGFDTLMFPPLTSTNHTYTQTGSITPVFIYRDTSGSCVKFATTNLHVFEVIAGFEFNSDSVACTPLVVNLTDLSQFANQWLWDMGNGDTETVPNPQYTYTNPGTYTIGQYIFNSIWGCKDSAFREVLIHPLPSPVAHADTLICFGDTIQLFAEGGIAYRWSPNINISNTTVRTPFVYPEKDKEYRVVVIDTNNCEEETALYITVQQMPTLDLMPDTLLIIGEGVQLISYTQHAFYFLWTPDSALSCTNCPYPYANPLKTTTYTLSVQDANKCFEISKDVTVFIKEEYSIALPDMFSPNGDGINDIIYVKGWGLKDLLEFKIFNRWGELVFESSDLNHGWDGFYKGKLQNPDTYVYKIKALKYDDTEFSQSGYIHLIK